MRSLAEVAAEVNAQLGIIASRDAGEGGGFDQLFRGTVKNEDDLVIRVGDSLEEGPDIFPLTALYQWLVAASKEYDGGVVTLRVRAELVPGDEEG